MSQRLGGPFDSDSIKLIPVTEEIRASLTQPRADDPLHYAIHTANARARQSSVAFLQTAFPSLPLPRFAQATDSNRLVVGHASASLIATLDPEAVLDSLFGRLAVRPGSHLKLVKDKEQLPLETVIEVSHNAYPGGHFSARPAAASAALREGYTAVLDAVDLRDPAASALAGHFERVFGCPVNINGYVSHGQSTSFGAHWDDQEVVVLQLIGHKNWSIEQPVALSMDRLIHGEETSSQAVWQDRVSPGAAIYVPRGWGHTVTGLDELTFHYTITVPRLNGIQVLDSLISESTNTSDETSFALPMAPSKRSVEPLPWEPQETERLLRNAVARSRFLIPRRSSSSLRTLIAALSLPLPVGLEVRCPWPGGWVVADHQSSAIDSGPPRADQSRHQSITAGMGGKLLSLSTTHLEQAALLTDGRVHRLGEGNDARVALALLRVGFLEAVPCATIPGVLNR